MRCGTLACDGQKAISLEGGALSRLPTETTATSVLLFQINHWLLDLGPREGEFLEVGGEAHVGRFSEALTR
jgi:hypothetical protein